VSNRARPVRPRARPRWAGRGERWPLGAVAAALAVAACTLLIYPLATIAPADSLGVVYLLAVLLISLSWGVALGVATAIASAAAFDYFHIRPDDSFAIAGSRNWVALIVFLIVALMGVVLARLTEQLRIEATERRRDADSRVRVLVAADEERRRVVRDLHDGAQQRLVHTVITLKLAQRAQRAGDGTVGALVDEALEHAEHATAELRDLAHGILPAALTRGGLCSPLWRRSSRGRRCRSASTFRRTGSRLRSRPPPTSSSPRR
jgi:K+-sensing histidine kinase KdpD